MIAVQLMQDAKEACSREAKKLCSECSRYFCDVHILRCNWCEAFEEGTPNA
jgi:hypothetical protein